MPDGGFLGRENKTYANTERSENSNKPANANKRVNSSIKNLCVF